MSTKAEGIGGDEQAQETGNLDGNRSPNPGHQ